MIKLKASRYLVLAAFVVVLGLFAISGYVAVHRMQEMTDRIAMDVNRNIEKSEQVGVMYESARTRIFAAYSMFLTDDPFDRNESYEEFFNLAGVFITSRQKYQAAGLTDYEQVNLEKAIGAISEEAYPALMKAIEILMEDDDVEEARRLMLEEAVPAQNLALKHLKMLVKFQNDSTRRMVDAFSARYAETRTFVT